MENTDSTEFWLSIPKPFLKTMQHGEFSHFDLLKKKVTHNNN